MRTDMINRFVLTRNASLKRLLNLALCFYEMKSKKTELRSYPVKLTIDPSNICQLRCPLCPTGQQSQKRVRTMMKYEDFKRIIDDVGEYIYEVGLYNWGEPFLNKDIYAMIALLKKKNINVTLNSNLNISFKEGDIDRIVNSGLDTLIVSLDGTSQESYEKYRRGGDIELVRKNIRLLAESKKRAGKSKPALVWQFLVNRFNEHEIPELDKLKEDLGVNALWISSLRCDTDKEIFLDPKARYESARSFLPSNSAYSRYDYEKKSEKNKADFCYFLWTTAAINADGSVSPCCALYDQKYDFGNVLSGNGTFRDIWNNEHYVQARRNVLKMPASKKTVCYICAKNGFIQS